MAVLSAQLLGLYAAFSMLAPRITVPSAQSSAEPTRKFE
jgi:hypothetical protein